MKQIPLYSLRPGESGMLRSLELYGSLRRRLRDMGMIPGTRISCAYVAPAGSPMAFWVRGAMLALRRSDCGRILVERE